MVNRAAGLTSPRPCGKRTRPPAGQIGSTYRLSGGIRATMHETQHGSLSGWICTSSLPQAGQHSDGSGGGGGSGLRRLAVVVVLVLALTLITEPGQPAR